MLFVSRKTIELLVQGSSWYNDFEQTGVGIYFRKEYRGKGYALESLKAYIEYFLKQYRI